MTPFIGRGLSGQLPLTLRPEVPFTMVGERTNVTGSRAFAKLIRDDNFEAAVEVARQQVENGAVIIDINMMMRCWTDGCHDALLALGCGDTVAASVPVMIDSSRWEVLEAGLQNVQGKAIVNSIRPQRRRRGFPAQSQTDSPLWRGRSRDGF